MPALRLLGRRWQVSTDILPLFAIFSTCFYVLLLIYIVVAFFITVNVRGCNDSAVGRNYLATVCLFLTEYVVSMFTALCITFIGLRGTPLEASKRKLMVPFLHLQVLNWVIQLGVLGYGTYVVASLQPTHDCWKNNHRRDLTRVLVYVSWVMIMILDWGRMLILYNIAPDLQRMSSWVWRLRILSWLTGNKDLIKRLRSTEDHPLERLTQLYTDLMRGVDLTPADEVVALLLLAAHQRNMRKRHIKRKLAGKSCCKGPPDLCKPSSAHLSEAVTQPDKQQPHHYPEEQGNTQHQQDAEVQFNVNQGDKQKQSQPDLSSTSANDSRHHDSSGSLALRPRGTEPQQDAASQPQHGSAQSQHKILLQQQPTGHHAHDDSACEHSQYAQQQVQQQQQHSQSGTQQAEVASSDQGSIFGKKQNPRKQRPTLRQIHLPTGIDPEQGWGRGADTDDDDSDVSYDDGDVAVFEEGRGCGFPCVLTPSSMAADLAPHLTHHQAAQIYLGDRDAVDDETLLTASKFAKYAIAAYGQFGLDYKDETGHHGASWKLAMGKRFHSYKKNKLVRSKVKTHKQRLHYEAIIQVAQIQDEDLLYLNFTNAAAGDVPYIICLDRPTRSVVLSIRGTQSLADGATDLLAYPHPLHHWLPDCYREKEEEAMYGHAGMLGAAAAVWEDLRTNHFLAALLDLPADEDCKPFHQDRGEQKYDSRMSHSEKDRHMAWESGNASVSDEASGEGSPAKDAANAGKHRSQGRPKFMKRHSRHGHADRSPAALPPAQRPHRCNQQTGETNGTEVENSHSRQHEEQKGKQEDDEQECGVSLDELGHENVGSQQALRNEDEQNKFVAGIIRKGLYKEGWKLVITGHSLGAGVAALLSLKMHQRAQGVKCWAFCPPGGLLSQNLSHAAEDYCTSIIVNKDMVPRLSLKTVYRLFEGKMIALARCNKTATRVLLHALRAGSRRVLLSDPGLFRPWGQVSSEAKDMLHRFQERPAEDSITTLGLEIGLYPPGRQIFLRRFKKESQPKRAEDVTWDAVWIQPEEIIGEGILVSKHAARDHYPFSLLSALEQVTDGAAGHVKRKTF